ncbi:hypothetical protein B7P43_G10335, partial [Cryptotermes secundus]
ENDSPAASQGVSTVTDEDDSPAIGQRDNTVTDEDDSPAIGQGDNTVTDHVNNPAIGQGDSTTTDKDDKSAIGQGDSPAIGQVDDRTAIGNGDRRSDRNEVNPVIHNRGDQCDFSTDAAFIFQEGEKHFLVVSVELIMTGAGTKNDEAENKVPEEDKNGQTLSLHASEVNENASSSTEVGSLNTNVEQGHMKLRQQNRARQLRALEKNNRSQRKILRILTERKGAHLEKEFESLRKVYALSLKKYMIIMKKQSRRMEMLIKCIRADLPDSDEDDE